MFIRMAKKSPALAAVAVLGMFGLAGIPAPALAQAPPIFTFDCKVYFRDVPVNAETPYACGPVRARLHRRVTSRCDIWRCVPNIEDRMQALQVREPGIGYTVLSANAFTMNPGTCRPTLFWSYSPWCSIGNSGSSGYVQMIAVVMATQ